VSLVSINVWRLVGYTLNMLVTFCIVIIGCTETFWPFCIKVKVNIKQYHIRPGQALRVPGGLGSKISRQSAHECGKVIPVHRPPLRPQEIILILISLRGWVAPAAQCDLKDCQWKIPMTPSGIEPATFWVEAQCPNKLRHRILILIYTLQYEDTVHTSQRTTRADDVMYIRQTYQSCIGKKIAFYCGSNTEDTL
jgi:hypothetical protein